jgi:uncharacterized membrane protein
MAITTPEPLARLLRRLEDAPELDRAADRLEAAAEPVLRDPRVRAALEGDRIGHALHPLLTDFPLGMWMSANYIDVFGGRRSRGAALGLLAGGLVAALPTIASGLAEWRRTAGPSRRVGVAHAAVNGTGFLLYLCSLVLRLVGRRRAAVAAGLAGGVTVTLGGYLGGHLSLVHKVGSADPHLMRQDAGPAHPLDGGAGASGRAADGHVAR